MNDAIVKNLNFGEEAKVNVFKGIEKLTKAVSSTLGASGKCVLLEDHAGNPVITKDGVTVANSIILRDPVENMGATLIKEAARKTVQEAGDGTTTATVLAHAILQEAYKLDINSRDLKNGINNAVDKVIKYLESVGEPNPFRYDMITMGAQPFSGGPKGSTAIVNGSNIGEISVELIKSEDRTRSAPQISALWRERIAPLPGVKQLYFGDVAAGGSKTAIDIEIAGQDLEVMKQSAHLLEEHLKKYQGLFDISDSYSGGKRELKLSEL